MEQQDSALTTQDSALSWMAVRGGTQAAQTRHGDEAVPHPWLDGGAGGLVVDARRGVHEDSSGGFCDAQTFVELLLGGDLQDGSRAAGSRRRSVDHDDRLRS